MFAYLALCAHCVFLQVPYMHVFVRAHICVRVPPQTAQTLTRCDITIITVFCCKGSKLKREKIHRVQERMVTIRTKSFIVKKREKKKPTRRGEKV